LRTVLEYANVQHCQTYTVYKTIVSNLTTKR